MQAASGGQGGKCRDAEEQTPLTPGVSLHFPSDGQREVTSHVASEGGPHCLMASIQILKGMHLCHKVLA